MKRSTVFLVLAVFITVIGSIGTLQAENKTGKKHGVNYSALDKAEFKEVIPGVSKSVLWGNPEKGAYGAYTKMKPGQDAGMHTHSSDVWMVVIKGAYLYKDDSGEKRVGPGDFIRVPAGKKHWSGSDTTEGALFYEEANGKFDLVPVK